MIMRDLRVHRSLPGLVCIGRSRPPPARRALRGGGRQVLTAALSCPERSAAPSPRARDRAPAAPAVGLFVVPSRASSFHEGLNGRRRDRFRSSAASTADSSFSASSARSGGPVVIDAHAEAEHIQSGSSRLNPRLISTSMVAELRRPDRLIACNHFPCSGCQNTRSPHTAIGTSNDVKCRNQIKVLSGTIGVLPLAEAGRPHYYRTLTHYLGAFIARRRCSTPRPLMSRQQLRNEQLCRTHITRRLFQLEESW